MGLRFLHGIFSAWRVLVFLGVVFFATAYSCRADLYTARVLSLNWLVDSADEIYHVEYTFPDGEDMKTVRQQVLKPTSGKSRLTDSDLAELQKKFFHKKTRQERLLFIRIGEDKKPYLVRTINLVDPMAHFDTAAFTREGEPIEDRDTILKMVDARIKLARKLPPKCVPGLIDDMASQYKCEKRNLYCRSLSDLQKLYLGGTLVPIDCEYWDRDPGPHDHDTILTHMVIPIDPEDRQRFYKILRNVDKQNSHNDKRMAIYALINFPGKETEAELKKLIRSHSRGKNGHHGVVHEAAKRVLRYSLFSDGLLNLPADDQLEKKLLGPWQLIGHVEIIDVDLKDNNSFTATGYDRDSDTRQKGRVRWTGKGRWNARDGKLSILREEACNGVGSVFQRRPRYFSQENPILKFTPQEVTLGSGLRMVRRGDEKGE